ncbi:HAMP domain-containing protein [Waterburya agarophytonicola K14]|uniref:HAMP domain-containing protein n=1 Tax=Waterburya agarophytonicola KI4 TaxID=2874699 RepID=A0A964FF84_9CYAN|nr:methyl-accepting chemotaxis protein [Waterburya agarophytonicola]MCC0176651.1 HAMP domain-containing protein [Waterburya agarophytonicola KI4]
MNNLPELPNQIQERSSTNSLGAKSPLLSKLYDLPISHKTSLIPWFSFAGLLVVLGAGGIILSGSLKNQLFDRAESRLNIKSQIIDILLADKSDLEKASVLEQAITAFTDNQSYSAIYLYQNDGELVLASSTENIDGQVNSNIALPNNEIIDLAVASNGSTVEQIEQVNGIKYVLAAKTLLNDTGKPMGVLIHGSSLSPINSLIKSSFLAQSLLSVVILISIIYLSKILGIAIAEPIQTLQKVAQDFADGNLKARAVVRTSDEVGLLGTTFNILADSIEINESRLKQDAERSRILKEIALEISEATDVSGIIQIVIESSKNVLNADRVIYHRFDDNFQGKIIAEAVDDKFPSALNAEIDDPCFAEGYAEKYQQGAVKAISNIYQAGLNECHLKMLEPFEVIASLITPIVINDKLTGLLIAHQCSEPRSWQQDEIDLFSQIASQTSTAIERVELLEIQKQSENKERAAKENLQRRALELLMEVDPVSRGDLTVQVKVKEDEIGTIGDSYNATIESLRKLVAQVQISAFQVSSTTSDKDISIQELSTGALAQTEEINNALIRIKGITDSIQAVASNAKSAEAAVLRAAETVKAGDDAMTQTVEGFQEIRDTVAETAKKVKRLGESSQKISKVVNVISNFADQTNLLALNASIEAAHAGEEGRGFAVVADEVRSLARQSAEATAEIEALVAEIQAETNEVVAAMESGTEQVVAGTKLVDRTRNSLIQIADVSQEINQLVGGIAIATVEQSQNSEVVTQTMMQVAAISNKTATEAGEVSASFKDLLIVAQELQNSVAKFKVS